MKKLVLAFALLSIAGPALAQDTPMDFTNVDGDKDGKVMPAEMKMAKKDMTDDQWAKMDSNKDGWLDKAEFDAMVKSGM